MRSIGSAQTDPFSSLAGAAAALYGPLHGGANEMVLRMLKEIGSVDKVPEYIKRVKAGEFRLMGFGHRVYRITIRAPASSSRSPTKVFESNRQGSDARRGAGVGTDCA